MTGALAEQEALVGAWRLVSVAFAENGGEALRGDGRGTDGMIIYLASGAMSAHIVLPARQESASQSHHAYFGTYSVDLAARTITHHRLANNNPGLPIEVMRGYRFVDASHIVLTPHGGRGDALTFEKVG